MWYICHTNAVTKPQRLNNLDCDFVTARAKIDIDLSSNIKMSVHLSSSTEVATTWEHSELVLVHLSSNSLQLFQGLLVIWICQLNITQAIVFLSSGNLLWRKRRRNRNHSGHEIWWVILHLIIQHLFRAQQSWCTLPSVSSLNMCASSALFSKFTQLLCPSAKGT